MNPLYSVLKFLRESWIRIQTYIYAGQMNFDAVPHVCFVIVY